MLQHATPAGYEGSDSDDDYSDFGDECDKNSNAGVPVAEDKALLMKRAIDKGDLDAVKQLLDDGMDVDTRLNFGWTPLMCAVNVANHHLAKLLLDRGANTNFRTDQFTVLMACCLASDSEDRIASCLELLLSKDADPNMVTGSGMTCLMLAARDGYTKIINLLAAHGAKLNVQDHDGYTALSMAAQSGRVEAVLELLKLGADKTIKTNAGKSPADLALTFKHSQVFMILDPSSQTFTNQPSTSKETISKFSTVSEHPSSNKSVAELDDLGLFLHGLDLGHISDIMKENGVTWSYLLTMEKDELEKTGITDPEDQQKLESAIQQILMDKVDLDNLSNLAITGKGEELQAFMISMRQQCCYMTETIQDVISHFPQQASQLVFSLDPKKEAQALCIQLELQVTDLLKEVTCLRKLISQMDKAKGCCQIPQPGYHSNRRTRYLTGVALSVLGAGILGAGVVFVLYKAPGDKV